MKTGEKNSSEVIYVAVLTRTVTPGMIKHSRQGQERPEVVKWLNFYFCLCEQSQSSEVTVETQAKTETRFASDFFFFSKMNLNMYSLVFWCHLAINV